MGGTSGKNDLKKYLAMLMTEVPFSLLAMLRSVARESLFHERFLLFIEPNNFNAILKLFLPGRDEFITNLIFVFKELVTATRGIDLIPSEAEILFQRKIVAIILELPNNNVDDITLFRVMFRNFKPNKADEEILEKIKVLLKTKYLSAKERNRLLEIVELELNRDRNTPNDSIVFKSQMNVHKPIPKNRNIY